MAVEGRRPSRPRGAAHSVGTGRHARGRQSRAAALAGDRPGTAPAPLRRPRCRRTWDTPRSQRLDARVHMLRHRPPRVGPQAWPSLRPGRRGVSLGCPSRKAPLAAWPRGAPPPAPARARRARVSSAPARARAPQSRAGAARARAAAARCRGSPAPGPCATAPAATPLPRRHTSIGREKSSDPARQLKNANQRQRQSPRPRVGPGLA